MSKIHTLALIPALVFLNTYADVPPDLQIEPLPDEPLQLEETTIQVTLKNNSDKPVRLLDRFSEGDLGEAFLVTIKDEEGKFVASSPFTKFLYPRTIKFKTLNPGAKISVPVNLGTFLYEQRPPLRHLLPVIEEGATYSISVSYTNSCEKTNETRIFCESKPVEVRFKKRPTPEYKIFGSVELSDPQDMTKPFPVDHPADGLLMTIDAPSSTISKEQDSVTVNFANKWDSPVNLWKLQPEEQAANNTCTLSFILCREDGTTVVNGRKPLKMNHDSQFNTSIEKGGQTNISISLKRFLPAYIFEREAEYYLIAKYENNAGAECLQGIWYSQPVKIKIAAVSPRP